MPPLPDRWVVVRTLLPDGRRAGDRVRLGRSTRRTARSPPLGLHRASPARGRRVDAARRHRRRSPPGPRRTPARRAASPSTTRSTTSPGSTESRRTASTATRRRTRSPAGGPTRPTTLWPGLRGPAGLDDALAALGWHVAHERTTPPPSARTPASRGSRPCSAWSRPPTSRRRTSSPTTAGSRPGRPTTSRSRPASRVDAVASVSVGPARSDLRLPAARQRARRPDHGRAAGGRRPAGPAPRSGCRSAPTSTTCSPRSPRPASASTPAQRDSAERLVSAFAAGTVSSLGSTDGLDDLEEHEHSTGSGHSPATRCLPRAPTGSGPRTPAGRAADRGAQGPRRCRRTDRHPARRHHAALGQDDHLA